MAHYPKALPTRIEQWMPFGITPFAPASSLRGVGQVRQLKVSGLRTTPCGFLRFPHADQFPVRTLSLVAWKAKGRLLLHSVDALPNLSTEFGKASA